MKNEPEEVLESKLTGTEKLLWAGRPPQGLEFQVLDAFLIPFFLIWAAIPLYMVYIILSTEMPDAAALLTLPFLAIAAYFLVIRFLVDIRRRAQTFYGVSNERVLIVSGVEGKNTRSIALNALPDLKLHEASGGSGVISFNSAPPALLTQFDAILPGLARRLGLYFKLPAQAREVFDLISTARPSAQ